MNAEIKKDFVENESLLPFLIVNFRQSQDFRVFYNAYFPFSVPSNREERLKTLELTKISDI